MPLPPRPDIQRAFLEPTIKVHRRIEIYEEDGKTPWRQDLWPDILIGGSVSIDYDRDERRTMDCELDNQYGELNPQAGGLWYDKRFKLFYGIELDQSDRGTRVGIVEQHLADGQAFELKKHLSAQGLTEVHFIPSATDYEHVEEYDVLVAISSTSIQKVALLTEAYNRGKGIITFSMDQTSASLPLLIGNHGTGTTIPGAELEYAPTTTASALSTGWQTFETSESPEYRKILAPATGAKVAGILYDPDNGESVFAVSREDTDDRRWVHAVISDFRADVFPFVPEEFAKFATRAVTFASSFSPVDIWECQLGEFMADSIGLGESYATIAVNARDLTKLCQMSKFVLATTFRETDSIETVVRSVAVNSGIEKFRLPVTNKTLGKDITWERDTPRWDVIRDVCNSNNYEVFFDNEGYLTMREFRDPVKTPATLGLSTGLGGNLISRSGKTSDSQLFNHIVVIGESSDTNVPPVYAEAINNNPSSPTSVSEIGDRVDIISMSLVTSVTQAQQYANSILAVSALEEFELSFEATLLPWIEAGDIVEMERSDSRYWGPDRYLLTSLSFPLDLTPMSGNGKRVEKVE